MDAGLADNDGHLTRLERSLCEIALAMPATKSEIVAIQKELIRRNKLVEGSVYLQVTRGAADRDFTFPAHAKPSFVMFTKRATY